MFKAHNIAKKQHNERAQPQSRKKWGLLEKKKDYKLRSQDYHRKQAHLKLLRNKAAQANEDEFNYGMIRSKTRNGVLVSERETSQSLSNDTVKLLKTQDEGYIRTMQQSEKNKIERAKVGMFMPHEGKRTVFVSDERDLKTANPKHRNLALQALPEDVAKERLEDMKKFKNRVERGQELEKLRREVDLQRELMKKGEKKKIVKDGKVTYKWKKVRQR